MITKDNYETYFLDYLEGNLHVDLVDEFIEFLQNNPELKEELDAFQMINVPDEKAVFPNKDSLLKTRFDSDQEFNSVAIAMFENELSSEDEEKLLSHIILNPEREKDLKAIENTFLSPDNSTVYKNKLYKTSVSRKIVYWSSRFAAIFIILFAISAILKEYTVIQVPEALYVKDIGEQNKIDPQKKKKVIKEKPATKVQPAKKVKTKTKANKSIRESNKGRLGHRNPVAVVERDKFIPTTMTSKIAQLEFMEESTAYLSDVGQMLDSKIFAPHYVNEEIFLAEKMKEKMGIKGFKFSQITKAGLDLASNISNNKVKYSTNDDGKVANFAFESRLLGFSISPKKNN